MDGAAISTVVSRLGVELEADESGVTVRVTDDGVGIQSEVTHGGPAADQDPQPEDGAAIGNGGTRTGLLAHGALVALIGGSLAVRNQRGPGTTVTIRVPRS